MSTNDDIRLLLCDPATLGEMTADGVHGRFALAGCVHNPDMFGAVEAAPGLYLLPETGWREGAALCVGEARPVGDDAGLGTTVSATQKGALRHRLEGAPCWKGKGYLLFFDTANDYRIIFPRPTREKLAEHYRAFESSPSLRNFNFEYHAFVLCRAIGRETLDGLDVLDVASGNGSFLSVLRGKGAHVTGFEPSESECREAAKSGLELINAPFTPAMLPEGRQYDVVIAGNIFEHVPDPVPFMERIRARLKPGGVALLPDSQRLQRHPDEVSGAFRFRRMVRGPARPPQLLGRAAGKALRRCAGLRRGTRGGAVPHRDVPAHGHGLPQAA